MGERDAPQGHDTDHVVAPGVLPQGGEEPRRQTDEERDEGGQRRELQGDGQLPRDVVPDVAAGDQGLAQVQREHVAEPASVLEGPRSVQPEGGAQLAKLLLGDCGGHFAGTAARDQQDGGVARQDPQGEERQQRDEDKRWEQLQEPLTEVAQHPVFLSRVVGAILWDGRGGGNGPARRQSRSCPGGGVPPTNIRTPALPGERSLRGGGGCAPKSRYQSPTRAGGRGPPNVRMRFTSCDPVRRSHGI